MKKTIRSLALLLSACCFLLFCFFSHAQFTSNSITGITAASVFGTNAPGSLTASNRFSTNALGWLTASNRFATNALGWLTASNRFATNALGWLTASNTFNTNAPGSLTASNRFTGTAQRVGIVTVVTNIIVTALPDCTNVAAYGDTTNFLAAIPFGGTYKYAGLGRLSIYNEFVQTFTNTVTYKGNATNKVLCTLYAPDSGGYNFGIYFSGPITSMVPNLQGYTGTWPNLSIVQFSDGEGNYDSGTFATNTASFIYSTNYP